MDGSNIRSRICLLLMSGDTVHADWKMYDVGLKENVGHVQFFLSEYPNRHPKLDINKTPRYFLAPHVLGIWVEEEIVRDDF